MLHKIIGNRVRYLRQKQKISQADLAELIGMQQAYISRLERGLENPSLKSLSRIASVLKGEIILMPEVYDPEEE